METINVNSNTYQSGGFAKSQYSKVQSSLLTKSMLISGIGFMIICGLSALFTYLFRMAPEILNNFGTVLGFVFGFLILSMIVSMLWVKILWKGKSTGLTITVYSIYIVMMSIAFGFLFAFLQNGQNPYTFLCVCFAVTGLIFLLVALIAKVITLNGILTYGKVVAISSIVMGVLMIAFFITMIVMATTGGHGWEAADVISWMCLGFVALVTFFYIIIDIRSIMGISEFNQYTSSEMKLPSGVVWYCGFRLLSDLVNVLFLVIIFLARFSRRIR